LAGKRTDHDTLPPPVVVGDGDGAAGLTAAPDRPVGSGTYVFSAVRMVVVVELLLALGAAARADASGT
jgi:hypothetical protein